MAGNGENNNGIPVPDPTKLTTDAVDRAKADLRHEMDARDLLWQANLRGERELRLTEHQALSEVVEERRIAQEKALNVALSAAKELQQ